MATTKEEIDSFHRFAVCQLGERGSEIGLDELLMEWYDRRDRHAVNAVICQGLEDIEAGRGRPAREVTEELRQE